MNIADSSSHLDYDTLADLAEGLLDGKPAASAGEHLAGCPECQDRSSQLADVTRILAEAPLPPLPAALAARIDAALADEAALSSPASLDSVSLDSVSLESASDSSASDSSASGDGLQPDFDGPRRLRSLRVLLVAAAAVVMLGGGATIAKIMSQSSVSPEDSKAQTGSMAPPEVQKRSAFGAGNAAGQARYRLVATGADYRDQTLSAQVNNVMKAESQDAVAAIGVDECVAALAQGRNPVLVDIARYNGTPATIVVIPGAAGGMDVLIGGPQCSTGHPDLVKRAHAAPN